MTVKLLLLKSGEDLISDIKEMVFVKMKKKRVIGYYLNRPCIVKMQSPNLLTEENVDKGPQKMGYQVRLHPWMPLTTDEEIPVPADWVVTIVNPTEKLKQMYIDDVVNYGKTIKVLVLTNTQILVSQIEEVGADIGEPDCKLVKPFCGY
jgi:hypothetical protein